MSTTNLSPAPSTPSSAAIPRRRPAVTIALVAMLALAAEILLAYLVLGGAPNPGMAAIAVLPLAAAGALWTGRRWALIAAALTAALVIGMRLLALSFDLGRPGDLVPFLLAAAMLLTAGLAAAAIAGLLPRRVAAPGLLGGGALLAAATSAGLLLLSPQGDDTGSLTTAQTAALPTVEMANYSYAPAQLRVVTGQSVAFRFTNDTDDTHTFAIDDLDVDVQVPSGRTRIVVVDAPAGDYAFYCSAGSHREDGMEGRLVITDATTDGAQPAADAMTDSPAHSHG